MNLNILSSKFIIIILALNQVFAFKINFYLSIVPSKNASNETIPKFFNLFCFFIVNDVSGMRLFSTLDYRPTEFGVLI